VQRWKKSLFIIIWQGTGQFN